MEALLQTGYGKPLENLTMGDYPKPHPKKGQVLIEVYAASVNPVDYKIILGNLKSIRNPKMPAPIGFDVSGMICEMGLGVEGFDIGDAVYSRVAVSEIGTIAQFVVVDAKNIALKPTVLSHTEAATVPLAGLTAYQAIFDYLKLKANQKILIHAGSGGVGSFAIQLAKHLGAYVATTTSSRNVKMVKELGADLVIDYTQDDYMKHVKDYDSVLDTLGGIHAYKALSLVKKGGLVVSIAGPKDTHSIKQVTNNKLIVSLFWMMSRKIKLQAAFKNVRYKYLLQLPNGKQLNELTNLLESNKIKPCIEKIFSFDKSIDAMKHVYSGRTRGKVSIEIKK